MLDIVLGAALAVVTALMAIFILKSFISQNNLNSANLCKQYYDDILRKHKQIWSEIGHNKAILIEGNLSENTVKIYDEDKITELLMDLEMISILVMKKVIRIDFIYESFSTLYFPCLYDPQIKEKIEKLNNGVAKNTYYNNYIAVAKLCKKYFKDGEKIAILDQLHL